MKSDRELVRLRDKLLRRSNLWRAMGLRRLFLRDLERAEIIRADLRRRRTLAEKARAGRELGR